MKGILYFFAITTILIGCKKEPVRHEKVLNDLLPEIIDTTYLELNKFEDFKLIIEYRRNLAYPSDEITAIKSIRDILGYALKSEQDSVNFLEPIDNLIARKASHSYAIEVDSLNGIGNIEIISSEKRNQKYSNLKSTISPVKVLRKYYFSNVYFNSQQTKGVFYCSYLCDGDCGQGDLIFIELKNGKWNIAHQLFLWVA